MAHDEVLPIAQTSRRLVPRLEDGGYTVRYIEFDGGHVVPPHVAQDAIKWLKNAIP